MNCLFYSYVTNGLLLKDTITNECVYYIGYSLKTAIKKHRSDFNLRYKHLRLIKI